jgi:hypothetical protein
MNVLAGQYAGDTNVCSASSAIFPKKTGRNSMLANTPYSDTLTGVI